MRAGTDCGISLKSYSDIKEGDVLECFVIKEIAQNFHEVIPHTEIAKRAEQAA